jgi:hypothetical protein
LGKREYPSVSVSYSSLGEHYRSIKLLKLIKASQVRQLRLGSSLDLRV